MNPNDRNKWEYEKYSYDDVMNIEDLLGHSMAGVQELDSMLTGVMTHLHETGADTFEILRDANLNAWWGKKLKEIKRQEREAAAIEKAKAALTKEDRKILGLNF